MSNSPLKVGIVGCGSFGRNAYAVNLVDHPDVVIAGLCDQDRGRAEALAGDLIDDHDVELRPSVYADYAQMVAKESLDVVMVGTMADVRPAVSVAALESGAHVLVAKPMAHSTADADRMLDAARRADRILMVGYNFRFRDDARAIKRFIDDGGIGTPLFARAREHAPSVAIGAPHYIKARSSGGALASTTIHCVDLAVWFLGCPPIESVHGQSHSRVPELASLPPELEAVRDDYDVDDLAAGFVVFEGGVSMTVEATWLAPPQVEEQGVDVWGTNGFASLSPLRLLSWGDGEYLDRTEEVAPGLAASFVDDYSVRVRREAHHFIDCVLGRATPIVSEAEMRADQVIQDGIYGTS
jgi:predicted dehydrogenase